MTFIDNSDQYLKETYHSVQKCQKEKREQHTAFRCGKTMRKNKYGYVGNKLWNSYFNQNWIQDCEACNPSMCSSCGQNRFCPMFECSPHKNNKALKKQHNKAKKFVAWEISDAFDEIDNE